MKTCLKCKVPKNENEFGKDSSKSDGKRPYCKLCARSHTASYREDENYKNRERLLSKTYNKEHKEERKIYRKKYMSNPDTINQIRKSASMWVKRSPERKLLYGAKSRSKEFNLPFDLTLQDIIIPEYCPIFHIKLEHGVGTATDNSPSLDRLIPQKGYVKGNIAIISYKANTIKQNATVKEIREVADWLEKMTSTPSPS